MEVPETIYVQDGREVETDGKVFTEGARTLLDARGSGIQSLIREKDGIFFRTPSTVNKELGHEVHLNPLSPSVTGSVDDSIHSSVPNPSNYLPMLIPDDDGVTWTQQADGIAMSYPSLRGHLLFHDVRPFTRLGAELANRDGVGIDGYNDLLAAVNYGQGNLGPYEPDDIVDLWDHIDSEVLMFDATDVAAPDGYPQTQEGIRWVRNDGILDRAYMNHDPDGVVMPGFQWVEETIGRKLAICYRNCD